MQTTFQTGSELDFIQLRRIAERFREALQQGAWDFHQISLQGCSSATTLILNRLEFDGQEFSKRPDMIRQSSSHARCAMAPLGLD